MSSRFTSLPRSITALISGVSLALISLTGVNAAPYGKDGRATRFTQPDGSVINLRVFGDEFFGRTETVDGRTVVYNSETGFYHVADLNADGSELVAGAVADGKPSKARGSKKVKISPGARHKAWQAKYDRFAGDRNQRWADRVRAAHQRMDGPQAAADTTNQEGAEPAQASAPENATTGGQVGLLILVQFPDDTATGAIDPVNFPATQAKMERYCNEIGYSDDGNTDSVRGYLQDQSGGALDYTQVVTPIVTLPNARNYYNYSNYPTNTTLQDSGVAGRLLIQHAVDQLLAQGFDFSGLTVDGANQIIATNVIFAGNDSGVWSEGLWPHSWSMPYPGINVGSGGTNKYVYRYQVTDMPTAAQPIGTYIHENGHMLMGYPDLYDYGGESEGVGAHALMGSGNHNNSGRTPAPINAYFKAVSGWLNYTELAPTDFLSTSLPSTGNAAYRYVKPGTPSEYFVIENRGDGDRWAASARDKGIMIWHIDATKSGNNDEQMTESQHYEVSLEQADGLFDLENGLDRGDTADLFDSGSPAFSDTTTPNAHWWDGTPSGIDIEITSPAGANMNVTFGASLTSSIDVTSPVSGSVFHGQTVDITWSGGFSGLVGIDLLAGGTKVDTLTIATTNDGLFEWTVPADLPLGSSYAIRAFSIDDGSITDTGETFNVAHEDFPATGTMPADWVTSGGGWAVTSAYASEGSFSLRSNPINRNSTASIQFQGDFVAGTLLFDTKVSSELGGDYFRFYVDGVAQDLDGSGTTAFSGEVNWTTISIPITAGTHTLRWEYAKDRKKQSGIDAAFIDNVIFPTAPLNDWIALYFPGEETNTLVSGLDADPDGDGIVNRVEYAFGTDPTSSGAAPTIDVQLNGSEVDLIYQSNPDATDATRVVEKSADLKSWADTSSSSQNAIDGEGKQTTTTTVTDPPAARTFFRIRVELN